MKIVTHIGSGRAGSVSLAVQVRLGPGLSCQGTVASVLSLFEVSASTRLISKWIDHFKLAENFCYLSPRSMPLYEYISRLYYLQKTERSIVFVRPKSYCDLPPKKVSRFWRQEYM